MKKLNPHILHKLPPKYIPWATAGIFILLAVFYRTFQATWLETLAIQWQVAIDTLIVIIFAVAVYVFADGLSRLLDERREEQRLLEETQRLAEEATQRLDLVLRSRQEFAETSDEEELVKWLLGVSTEIVAASGASFVPLDEHGLPLAAIGYGETPFPVPAAWIEYLASPAVRNRCTSCDSHNHLSSTCPLLKGPFTEATGMYCLPLERGDHEYGVLNLYISDPERLDHETRDFLQSVVDETALAMEGIWLRKRELSALRQLQEVRQKADLSSLLSSLLENVHQTLESDFALLVVNDSDMSSDPQVPFISTELTCGDLPPQARPFIEGILQGVLASGEALAAGNLTGDLATPAGVRAILAAPLVAVGGEPHGVLLVGKQRSQSFHQRQLTVLQTFAGQLALVVQNNQQLAKLEYKTIIEERTRLAREIHDGLAQTLGFLKLQVAQMKGYLERGDTERLKLSLGTTHDTLKEAYEDARSAIDGLRISAGGNKLETWLEQTLNEFQDSFGSQITVEVSCEEVPPEIPPEVHAQLIRIVQESLSNIRKHTQAAHVWVRCYRQQKDYLIEIQDDGQGFTAEDVPGLSQHGLRGMRERTELIGADFQIVSQPGQGTLVRVTLPIQIEEAV